MGPPCNKLLPPPLPCSRNDAKLSVISRVFALPMESASSSSSRSLDDGEKERGRGAGERGVRRGHRFIFGNNSHHLFSRVTRVPIRPADRQTSGRSTFFAERRRREIGGGARRGVPVVALLPFLPPINGKHCHFSRPLLPFKPLIIPANNVINLSFPLLLGIFPSHSLPHPFVRRSFTDLEPFCIDRVNAVLPSIPGLPARFLAATTKWA